MAILVVLSATLYTAFVYVKDTTLNYANTLADSLLRQADNALGLYEENLKYNAESLCQFMITDDLDPANSIAGEALLSSYYSQIALENREIVSAVILDSDLNTITSLGRAVELPDRQLYLRTETDMNADWYYTGDDCYYGFYCPIYSGTGTGTGLKGMCVFVLETWRIDGTLHRCRREGGQVHRH